MPIAQVRKHITQKYPQVIPWVIWMFAVVFYLYQMILRISSSVLADDWITSFHISTTELGLLSGAYYYSYGALQIPAGIAMDRWGPRSTLTMASLICALGCVIMATASSYGMAFGGRFIVGVGASCGFLGCLKIASLWFPHSQIGLVAGLTTSLGMIGGIIGNVPFAALNALHTWRAIQWALGLMGVFIALTIWMGIRNHHPGKSTHVRESAEGAPLIPANETIRDSLGKIIQQPQSWIMALFGFCMYTPLAAFTDLWGISFFKATLGISEKDASSLNSLTFLGLMIGGPLFAIYADYVQSHRHAMRTSALLFSLMFGLLIFSPWFPTLVVASLCLLFGVSFGGEVIAFVGIANTMPRKISGLCSGFTNTIVVLSGVLFQPFVGWLLGVFSSGQSPDRTAYILAFLPAWVCTCCAIVLTFFMIETHPNKRKPHTSP
ncbi:MAG: MFS transporter [Alphaproteobacteria bacterium]|nr:MAG: MFS transporter [Alphaproteobacteria bacterium]